jgi:glucose dehydrogenase/plastocyanin
VSTPAARASVIVLVATLLAACSGASSGPPAASAPGAATSGWPSANHDLSNTRAAPDSSINSSNVSDLGVAWTYQIPGVSAYGAAASSPLIEGDTVYFQDLASNVAALRLDDGSVVWTHRYGNQVEGPNGPALADGTLYVASSHHDMAALDAATGDQEWSRTIETSKTAGVDIQPVVVDGRVLTSTVPGNEKEFYAGGDAGVIHALDSTSGQDDWTFDTVDSKNLWGDPKINSGGGAWYPPAFDPATGVTYWGIGNPAPWPGTALAPNGSSRPGDNLYTNSIVALRADSGDLQWYHQVTPHDLFDLDFQISPILVNDVNGTDLVLGAGKSGIVAAFDRSTGDVVWQTDVGEHHDDRLNAVPKGTTITVAPGPLGGVETPMAYANRMVFVPVLNLPARYTSTAFQANDFDVTKGTGEFVAIDVATGGIVWDAKLDSMPLGGATVVGDLVFTATYDGLIHAYSMDTGDEVWSYQAPAGINAWPAVSGDTIVWPAGVPSEGSAPVLLALRLGTGGGSATPTPSAPATASPTATDGGTNGGNGAGNVDQTFQLTSPSGTTYQPTSFTASGGTSFAIHFTNDSGIPHNVHVYAGPDASAPSLGASKIIQSGDERLTFEADGPGTYFFQCDVHPGIMTGTITVK